MSTKKLATILILANSFALSIVISIWMYQTFNDKIEAIMGTVVVFAFIFPIAVEIISLFDKKVKDKFDDFLKS